MFRNILCVVSLLTVPLGNRGFAQDRQEDRRFAAHLVKTGLFVIWGEAGNSLLRLSANGPIAVDGKLPGNDDALRALVKKLSFSDQPVRMVITTDHHQEATGSNARFMEAGAQIVAHENVKHNLIDHNPPDGKIASQIKTYKSHLNLRLGGIEVQLKHFGNPTPMRTRWCTSPI